MISWKRHVIALLLFGTAFGYLEAAVVSYLRLLHEPVRLRYYPTRPAGELFPLLTAEQAAAAAGAHGRKVLLTEVGREAATIVMLAGVALAVSTNAEQWAAAFVVAFGVWDITFYVFLRLLLGWPASLFTWDVLFLIPVPWIGPVIAPVLVSSAMVLSGIWHLRREGTARPVRLRAANWVGILCGAVVILVSFTLDSGSVRAGGMPSPFHWWVFWMGMTIGLGGYASAALSNRAKARATSTKARLLARA